MRRENKTKTGTKITYIHLEGGAEGDKIVRGGEKRNQKNVCQAGGNDPFRRNYNAYYIMRAPINTTVAA